MKTRERDAAFVLGIDVGTTGVKAILLRRDLSVAAVGWQPCTLLARKPGWAEEEPDEWRRAVCLATAECLRAAGAAPSSIAAVGVSGMVPALVLLDGEGKVIRPSLQQNDARAAREIEEIAGEFGAETIFARTGSGVSQQSLGPKLRWLARHEPEALARTRTVLGSYDYINWLLTGERMVERNWALESGLYDAARGDWYEGMLAAAGCQREWLPRVVDPTDEVGRITPQAAEMTGLAAGTPVVGGSADHIAAALAAGLRANGDVLIKIGGAGDILFCLDRWAADPRMYLDYHDIPGLYLINGCMASSGSVLKWFDGMVSAPPVAAAYAELDRAAAEVPAGSAGLVILPYFLGEKTPICDPLARGVFFGLTLSHTRSHLHRAIMEAVAFGFRHHLEVLRELGLEGRRVFVSDGGARSELWRQIIADVTGQRLHHVGEHPGSCAGVAYVAGMAAGLFPDWETASGLARVTSVAEPRPDESARYDGYYRIYRDLYADLRGRFRELASLGETNGN